MITYVSVIGSYPTPTYPNAPETEVAETEAAETAALETEAAETHALETEAAAPEAATAEKTVALESVALDRYCEELMALEARLIPFAIEWCFFWLLQVQRSPHLHLRGDPASAHQIL